MEATLRGTRKKIHSLKSEISQLKSSYSNQIKPLKEKARSLSQTPLAVGMFASKLAEKRSQKREEIVNEINRLEKELDEKITPLQKELEKAKRDYRDNYDKLKENDKKVWRDKIDDIKFFIDHNKLLLIVAAVLLGIVVLVIVVSNVSYNITADAERNRNYYINTSDTVSYVCNAKETAANTLECEKRQIVGEFSNYDTVEFDQSYSYKINGDKFSRDILSGIPSLLYKTNDFNASDPTNGFDTTINLNLKNNILNETVVNKTVRIHYDFSEADIQLISEYHNKWVQEEAEKAAKAQQEAEEKARKEAEERAKKEAAEQAAREEAERKAAEEAEKKATESGNNPSQIPSDEVSVGIAACQRVANSKYGLKIKTTEVINHYSGNEDYTWMYVFRGSSYDMITCQYSWKTGYAQIMYIRI